MSQNTITIAQFFGTYLIIALIVTLFRTRKDFDWCEKMTYMKKVWVRGKYTLIGAVTGIFAGANILYAEKIGDWLDQLPVNINNGFILFIVMGIALCYVFFVAMCFLVAMFGPVMSMMLFDCEVKDF